MSVVEDLRKLVPGVMLSDNPSDRVVYGRDLWPRDLIRLRAHDVRREGPSVVVWPRSQEEVRKLIGYACGTQTPIVPFGAGSGVCGAITPSRRTLVVDLKRLSGFRLEPEQGFVRVGAGTLGITLENELEALGYTVGHFPSSILCSTVGGWLAARGAGQCSGKYGKIEDMTVGLDAVLGTGSLVEMNWRAGGPNLAPLMIGSEGTLGVITGARLRLHPLPDSRAFSGFSFADVESGWQALREMYQAGLRPAVARLYDALDSSLHGSRSGSSGQPSAVLKVALRIPRAINQVVRAIEGTLLRHCQLVLVFEGEASHVADDARRARAICHGHGGRDLGEAPARAWLEHRYSVSYRQSPIFRAGAFSDTMEVAAPWSKLKAVYEEVRRALGRYVIVLAHLSHAYPDGCSIYFTFSASTASDEAALALYDELWPAALRAAIGAGATLSHHHGVGRNKRPVVGAELGDAVELLRRLKGAWDPAGVLNPGCLLPPEPVRAPAVQVEAEPCVLDEMSLLADLDARLTLDECENLLSRRGYTLRITGSSRERLADWLSAGMPGAPAPWDDPVDHVLVALIARLAGGRAFSLAPVPRRAVGPDLSTLFVGETRVGEIVRATLRVHPVNAPQARALPARVRSSDVLSDGEASAWQSAVDALATA